MLRAIALGFAAAMAVGVGLSIAAERNEMGAAKGLNLRAPANTPAINKRAPMAAGGVYGAPAAQATALTTKECEDLGGTVKAFAACNSGQVCNRVDENRVGHAVCINSQ